MKRVTRTLLCALFFSTLIAPVSHADSDTALLTICTSLKSGYQLISKTGKCNERIYEARTWFQKGSALYGTSGSTMLDMRTCIRKSSKVQIIGTRAACNSKIYTTALWQRPLGPSVAPSITSVAMGLLGTATLNIAAPIEDGGAKVTSYLVTSTPGQLTATYTPAQIKAAKITGLTPGSSYSFSVVAINIKGPSPSSIASASTLAPTIPSAPSITKVIATGTNSAQLSFSPPLDNGGLPITSYVATSSPGSLQTTVYQSAGGTINITNLSHSTTYTFTLTAINTAGSSLPSAISASITTATPAPEPATPAPEPAAAAPALAAPAFTLSSSSETRTVNTVATGFTINSTGGAIASFAISATPAGMSFSTSTGALTGTPTSVAGATAYTVTATNASGSTTATFTLTVTAALAAPAFTLSASSENRTVNTAATGFTINSTGGAIASFAISATPAGMSFSTSTGALTGTPTSVAGATAYTVTATNATGSVTQTFTLTVSPGSATKAMMTTQPAGAVSGSAFTTQPVVRVTDSSGNTVTTSTAVVTASKASGSGTLSGTTTATAVAGIATFTNLVITGTGDHVLTFTPDTLTPVTSETLTVSLLAQATLTISSLTTNTKAHPYSQALSITTSGGSGTGATTFAIASGGTATGCTLSNSTATATITATTVGTCLIQATKAADATYSSATSAPATFTFQVGSATKAMMTTQPAGAASGSQLATQPVVRVTDSGDNTVTSFTGSVVASIASGTGTLSNSTATAVAGVATFTDLVITGTAGNFTLTFTPTSLTPVTSSSLAIAAGVATAAAITTQPTGAASGSQLETQPVIRIVDASGNTVTSSTVSVVASIASGTGTLSGTTTVAAVAGIATFTNLVITATAGNFTLTFTPTSLTPVTSSSLAITTTTISAPAIAGVTAPVTGATPVSTTTAGTGYTGAVTWASSGGALGGTFAAATVYTATITLTPTSGYTLTGVSANFFTVAGATPVTNLANAGVITAVFPATTTTISAPAIAGVTAPVTGATPVSTTTAGTGYTGTVAWSGSPATFASATTYTATITLTAAAGYTLTGVTANFFTVAGAGSVTHSANSGVITGVFYMVGSTGPGGGKVFYVATTPFDCGPTLTASCTYLEAAPDEVYGTYLWASDIGEIPTGTAIGTAIGTGYKNTLAMIGLGDGNYAGQISRAYRSPNNNLSDWFLPSKDEIYQMCLVKRGPYPGDCEGSVYFSTHTWWSSTRAGPYSAYIQDIIHGGWTDNDIGGEVKTYIWPVRSF